MLHDGGYLIRLATAGDMMEISLLYHEVYRGKYPDSLMGDFDAMKEFISLRDNIWVVAEKDGRIVSSVLYEADRTQRLGKVFGGLVLPPHRGGDLLKKCMVYGVKYLSEREDIADVIYATTRTVSSAPQKITESLGYRKLGIFPNIHRTDIYETHALTALFCNNALERRFTDFELHPEVVDLYKIVQRECGIPGMAVAERDIYRPGKGVPSGEIPALEIIEAPEFVFHRFNALIASGELPAHFYPFHRPNIMISSPDQRVELFLFLSLLDSYCTVIGIKKPMELSAADILLNVSGLLRDRSIRYIEIIVRAHRVQTLDHVLEAGFTPCAYFPAFQLREGFRYDYVILSKTFEIFDFSNIRLEGTNRDFLLAYYKSWKRNHLDPVLLEKDN